MEKIFPNRITFTPDDDRFRADVSESLRAEFPEGDGGIDVERLWQRLVPKAQMPDGDAKPKPHSWTFPARTILALAAGLFLVVNLRQVSNNKVESLPSYTVKGDQSLSSDFTLSSLRFAIVGVDGELTMGHGGMILKVGAPLVFAVEAHGLDRGEENLVSLFYQFEGQEAEPLVESYALHNEHDVMRGAEGYYSFSPPRPGHYTFTMKALPKAGKAGALHDDKPAQSVRVDVMVSRP